MDIVTGKIPNKDFSRGMVTWYTKVTRMCLHIAIDPSSSTNSTPNTSPSASLLRGQVSVVEAHLDTLYRQNEQQRVLLTELFTGLGLKAGASSSTVPLSSKSHPEISHAIEITALATPASSTKSEHGQGDKLQVVLRENDSLRRDNEALKRELERLRRGGN